MHFNLIKYKLTYSCQQKLFKMLVYLITLIFVLLSTRGSRNRALFFVWNNLCICQVRFGQKNYNTSPQPSTHLKRFIVGRLRNAQAYTCQTISYLEEQPFRCRAEDAEDQEFGKLKNMVGLQNKVCLACIMSSEIGSYPGWFVWLISQRFRVEKCWGYKVSIP